MCGIIGSKGTAFNKQQVIESSSLLNHRGPDATGIYDKEDVLLVHKRLSIIDLSSTANQPFVFEDLVLIFNGEIYNYNDVKKLLIEESYIFETTSDTEVLIKAFHKWGINCVHHFLGMFAFCMYNTVSKEMFLVRDRLGVKPLYYLPVQNSIAFASELKALVPLLEDKTLSPAALTRYFQYGYTGKTDSIFSNIKKVPPGHYLYFLNGAVTINKYWQLEEKAPAQEAYAVTKEKLKTLLTDAFSLRMVADVPVGVFLSGGIDSSLVTSVLQKKFGNISTFSIGFNNKDYNEATFAKAIAEELHTSHFEFYIDIEEVKDYLHRFYDIYDEPFYDTSGIPSTIIAKMAAEKGIKVVLTGDGGDELFAGYEHHATAINQWNRYKNVPLRKLLAKLLQGITKTGILSFIKMFNIEHRVAKLSEILLCKDFEVFFNTYRAVISRYQVDQLLTIKTEFELERFPAIKDELNKLTYYDFTNYLPDDILVKMDRATMYNSIENREPLLDHRICEFAYQIPAAYKINDGVTKYILRDILKDYIPAALFERPKKGFSVPMYHWLTTDLLYLCDKYFSAEFLAHLPELNSNYVMKEYRKFRQYAKNGKQYNFEIIWRLVSYCMWREKYLPESAK